MNHVASAMRPLCHWLAGTLLMLVASAVSAEEDGRLVVLLGETDPYLRAAAQYWGEQWSPQHVVSGVASLAQLREVLATHPGRGEEPWQDVVLVSHASEWLGLALPLFAGDTASTPGRLVEAHSSGAFPPLRGDVLASNSSLRLEGCGIGRRPEILSALSTLLSGERAVNLTAPNHLIAYTHSLVGPAQRLELPYISRIVSDARHAERVLTELRQTLQDNPRAQGFDAWEEERYPVGLRQRLPDGFPASRVRPIRIAERQPLVRARLRELGLETSQLQWRLESGDTQHPPELVGEALVLVVRPDPGIRGY